MDVNQEQAYTCRTATQKTVTKNSDLFAMVAESGVPAKTAARTPSRVEYEAEEKFMTCNWSPQSLAPAPDHYLDRSCADSYKRNIRQL